MLHHFFVELFWNTFQFSWYLVLNFYDFWKKNMIFDIEILFISCWYKFHIH